MRPCCLLGAAPCHNADMTAADTIEFFVLAAKLFHYRFGLTGRRDVIGFGDYIQNAGRDFLQINGLASEYKRAVLQTILLVELVDQLPVGAARHGNRFTDPSIHGVPRFHHARVIDAIPEADIVADEVLHGFQRLRPIIDQLSRDISKSVDDTVGIKLIAVGPASESARLGVGEVERCGEQDQIFQTIIGPYRGIERANQGTQAPTEQIELLRTGDRLYLAHDAWQVVEHIVVELHVLVFRSWSSPVEQKNVVAAISHVFDKAVSRTQIKDMRPIHDCEHQQQRHSMPLLVRYDRDVSVELGFVERPDQRFRCLGNSRIGRQQPVERLAALTDFL